MAKMPTLAALVHRHAMGLPFVYRDNDLSYCGNFLLQDKEQKIARASSISAPRDEITCPSRRGADPGRARPPGPRPQGPHM